MQRSISNILTPLLMLIVAGFCLSSCNRRPKNTSSGQGIEDTVLAQVNTFYHFVKDTFQPAVAENKTNAKYLQQLFLKSRLLYKRFEWAAAYFMGGTTQRVNGPPVQEVEEADLLNPAYAWARNPSGLQVIEGYLFPKYDPSNKEALLKQLKLLESNCELYQAYFSNHPLNDWRILDAAKLEVFRILTLGITGYDNPLTLNSMNESAASLESLKNVLARYTRDQDSGLIHKIRSAIAYLHNHTNFNSFNRAIFITKYGNAISTGITELTQQLNLPDIKYNRMLHKDAKTLFAKGVFNVNAFAPGSKYYITKEKIELGKKLFFNSSLSGPGTRSCASCHQPDKAFTDGLKTNLTINGKKHLPRNTPTLINAALQSNYFYDMRALTLEQQSRDVIENDAEMNGSLKDITNNLRNDTTYVKLFSKAFPKWDEPAIDSAKVLNALASYIRSLTKLNSRFDQYMRGDSTALTKQEIKGFNLFMGKAKCATCHFMPLFNGITPPKYIESEAEIIGIPESLTDSVIDPDLGWYKVIGIKSYKHAFKTPTLRNIARTAPYMHNGVYDNLKQVMVFYNNGGPVGLGFDLKNQTLPEDSLQLTDKEIDDIIAFMKSLNDR